MEKTRGALIGVIVGDAAAVERINDIFHEYRRYIIGRLGIPYKERDISIISITVDAPQAVISAISGKLGMIDHVSSKTIYAKVPE